MISLGVILIYANEDKLFTLLNSFISDNMRWFPFVPYLKSSVVLRAIYMKLWISIATQPFLNMEMINVNKTAVKRMSKIITVGLPTMNLKKDETYFP